eukprot:TRINITY_DN54070_c0_g1_i1.p1 TRINITY_DN54070_c0_g1~~TRINITY_DN54070_c0_g1_i1.p1  ORF type:complete len:536 (-),score=68.16 TRINITY_DN54070_c0_g1_i1:41-1648(-)
MRGRLLSSVVATLAFAHAVGYTHFKSSVPEHLDEKGHGHGGSHGHKDVAHADTHGNGHGGSHGDGHGHGDSHGHRGGADSHRHADAHDDVHGQPHHVGGHEIEVYDPVASALAKMLFGTMAFVMALFYFVNWPDPDIVKATWCTLNDMISIFCAVLIFSALCLVMADFAEADPHHHGPPTTKGICISYCRYIFLVIILELVLIYCKHRPWLFKYCATLLAHVCGFAAIDCYGSTLQYQFFSESLLRSVCGVVLFSSAIVGVAIFTGTLRQADEGSEHWKEECTEVRTDYAALANGLLFSMVIRSAISGSLPPVHGAPRHKTFEQVWTLFVSSMLVIPLVLVASHFKKKFHDEHASALKKKLAETAQQTACFTMGWTLLYWGYWQFYQAAGSKDEDFGPGGKMLQRLTMAIVFSVIVFFAIVVIDKLADTASAMGGPGTENGLRALLKTFSLLMGLSWEACFNQGVTAIGLQYHGSEQTIVIVILTLATCSVVLPAWALYILPNTLDADFEAHFLGEHGHDSCEHGAAGVKKVQAH